MAQHSVALCIQDTTELDFNGQQMDGLARLSYEAQHGMVSHPTLAVSPSREPLGLLDKGLIQQLVPSPETVAA